MGGDRVLVPESGQLIDLAGWGGVMGFEESGAGDVIQNQTSPDFKLGEVGRYNIGGTSVRT